MVRFGLKSLFHELRRRRVFNTIAIYIVGAWAALQVSELALPALDIPDRAIRYVWLGALALLPLVLLFGWRYDISTGGVRRTAPVGAETGAAAELRRGDRWYIGVLSALGLAVVATALSEIARTEPEEATWAEPVDYSIAVLPFDVCADQPGDRPLAEELTEEVLNSLAERSTLKVMARGSTYQLATAGLPRARIASELNVQYIVSGRVCREQGRLTVAAELSDRDDFIVERDRYEQQVNEFGQIVVPVAAQVADRVAVALGVGIDPQPERAIDRRAFEQFLLSRERARRRDQEGAMKAIERALEYEPDFAEALVWKAMYTVRGIQPGRVAESLEQVFGLGREALEQVDRQIEFGLNNAQTQFVAGVINHELGHWNEALIFRSAAGQDKQELARRRQLSRDLFTQAETHFRATRAMNPSFTGSGGLNVYSYLADTLEHLGLDRRNEALEIYEAGLEVEPWSPWFNASVAKRRSDRGRYREALELLDRFRQLPEVPGWIWYMRRLIVLSHHYYDDDCEQQLWIYENEPGKLKPGSEMRSNYINFFSYVVPHLGLEREAEAFFGFVDQIEDLPDWARDQYLGFSGRGNEVWDNMIAELTDGLSDEEILLGGEARWAALALARTGEEGRAATLMEAYWAARGTGPGWWGNRSAHEAAETPLLLVQLLFRTGRPEAAAPVLEELRRHLEAEHDIGIRHPATLGNLAKVYAFLGRDEDALAMLRKAVDYHLRWNEKDEWWVDVYSPWARFRDDPRFEVQLNRIETDLQQQARTIRSMLARYDMDDLIKPLLAGGVEAGGD